MDHFDARKDYYRILRVGVDATSDEINKMYRQQAGKRHPDRGGSDEDMKALNEAYEVLSNSAIRRAYDIERGIKSKHGESGTETDAGAFSSSTESFDVEKVQSRAGGDIFGLAVGALVCLGLGLPFLILIEIQWVFFLWPLRILAWGVILIGVLLARAAFRHKYRQMVNPKTQSSWRHAITGEVIFWLIAYASAHLLYIVLRAVYK